jgi:hypothetical protein
MMLNADRLIDLRRQGYAPDMVYIDLDFPVKHDRLWPFDPQYPLLHIGPDENVRRIDMRCLVGLTVQIAGEDADRVQAVTEACINAKAERVIACTYRPTTNARLDLASITDTEGTIAWHKS